MKLEYKKWRLLKLRSFENEDEGKHLDIVFFPLIWARLTPYISFYDFLKEAQTGKVIDSIVNPLLVVNHDINCCPVCKGRGKLDWIQQATGVYNRQPWRKEEYFKISSKVVKHYTVGKSEIQYCTSIPLLDEGEKVCPLCFGCGADINQPHGKITFYNSLGHTYQKVTN